MCRPDGAGKLGGVGGYKDFAPDGTPVLFPVGQRCSVAQTQGGAASPPYQISVDEFVGTFSEAESSRGEHPSCCRKIYRHIPMTN